MIATLCHPMTFSRPAGRTFDACYREHRARVFHWALRYGSKSFAEDLAQDVFLRLHEQLPSLSGQDDLGGWLYRVTVNLALQRLRRERSWLGRVTCLLRGAVPDSVVGPDSLFEVKSEAAKAMAAVDALPPRERVVATMLLIDGKSQSEICELLGFSKGYVSKLWARARERLAAGGWEVPDVTG